ncbi:hypothetical protein SAMN02745866_03087 [Alteromonadaceae bacterium Bs31]|nr:hypothetical protein SAMN02745866_03087 [Alteromonadaceae bacterium Bs31]
MPFFIISLLIQVALVIHIVKTGRNTTWIWIVVMLPLAGSIAYFILEVLPELSNSRTGRRAGRKVRSSLNPNKDISSAARQYSMSDTVENSIRLADECLRKGLFVEARELYQKCLKGLHADDPNLMFGLAKSEFGAENYYETKEILDKLIALNPDYKNQDAHLLYARALEKLGDLDGAKHEYEALHDYYSGPEASYYYAVFLKSQNQMEQAQKILLEIMNTAKYSGKHYSTLHKETLKMVKSELS